MTGPVDEPLVATTGPARARRARWLAFLSLGSGTVNQLALLVTGVLAARALGPDGRGTQALLTLLPFVLTQVGTLGLPTAVVYFAGAAGSSPRSLVALLRRPVSIQLAVTSVAQVAPLLVVAHWHDTGGWHLLLLVLPVLPLMIVLEYAVAVLQGQHRFVAYQVLRTAPGVLYALALGWLVASAAEVGLGAVLLCWAGAQAVVTVVACAVVRQGLTSTGTGTGPAPGLAADMRSFGRRSFLGVISPLENLRVDQLVAGVFLGPAALGLYVSASAFTGLTRTLSQSVGVIAYPDVARRHRAGEHDSALHRGLRYVAFVAASTTVVAVAVALAAPWLVTVTFGPEFSGAAQATRVLIVAGALLAVRRVAGDVARGLGRAAANSWAEGVTLAALVVAFLAFGSAGSAGAAAWAVLVAAACGLLTLGLQFARPGARGASA